MSNDFFPQPFRPRAFRTATQVQNDPYDRSHFDGKCHGINRYTHQHCARSYGHGGRCESEPGDSWPDSETYMCREPGHAQHHPGRANPNHNPDAPRLYDFGAGAFRIDLDGRSGVLHTADCSASAGVQRGWLGLADAIYNRAATFCGQCDARDEWNRWSALP